MKSENLNEKVHPVERIIGSGLNWEKMKEFESRYVKFNFFNHSDGSSLKKKYGRN